MGALKNLGRKLITAAASGLGGMSWQLYRACKTYVLAYKNFEYDFRTNGECFLMDRLRSFAIQTVFDVGANRGEWTAEVLDRLPSATVHAFEIVPATFAKLRERHGTDCRVRLNSQGLADTEGSVSVNVSSGHDGVSSIIVGKGIHDIPWTLTTGQVVRGDDYCRQAGVDRIDLLKIDVEGAEPLVIKGLTGMFDRQAIAVVQFEYGLPNIYSRFLLKDFHAFFESRGYAVGKLMPKGVLFKTYHPLDEDFVGPNYVAVSRARADIIDALRLRHPPKGLLHPGAEKGA